MEKIPVIKSIKERWSPYSFSPARVEEEKLEAIFEAARLAPSSMNEQPWLFVFTTKDDRKYFDTFLGFLYEANRIWARNAYVLCIVMTRKVFSGNNSPNRHALYDTGMAVGNLLAQATSMGLYVHQMGGFSVEEVKKHFATGDLIEPVAMMAIGYAGNGTELGEELRARDMKRRPRKELKEFVFRNELNTQAFEQIRTEP